MRYGTQKKPKAAAVRKTDSKRIFGNDLQSVTLSAVFPFHSNPTPLVISEEPETVKNLLNSFKKQQIILSGLIPFREAWLRGFVKA